MKKQFITMIAVAAMGLQVQAQNWLTAGNTATGTEKLGTLNNKSFDIITNNTTRMKINNKGNIGIGLTTLTTTDRLSVKNVVPAPTGVYTMTKGIFSEVTGNPSATYLSPGVGVYGKCDDNNGWGYGGYFEGDQAGVWSYGPIGVYGLSTVFAATAIGIEGYAETDDADAYGVYGHAESDVSLYNTGVYGLAEQGFSYNIGVEGVISIGSTGAAGYFDGDLEYTGNLYDVSDAKFKTDVQQLTGALDKILLLSPKVYALQQDQYQGLNFGKPTEFGFIAQDIEKVFPEMVKNCTAPVNPYVAGAAPEKTAFTYKAVNYTMMIPVLTAAIQEQQTMIDSKNAVIDAQQKEIDALNVRMANIEKMVTEKGGVIPAAQMGSVTPVLEQNVPNPFNGNTEIRYFIPDGKSGASIVISDLSGKELNHFDIANDGSGSVVIQAGAMPAGIYLYALVIDGVITDSKMMNISK